MGGAEHSAEVTLGPRTSRIEIGRKGWAGRLADGKHV